MNRETATLGGTGPAVVCLHGWPGCWFDYRLLRPLLEPVADVVALDLRGLGRSDRPNLPPAAFRRAAQAGGWPGPGQPLLRWLGSTHGRMADLAESCRPNC